MRRRRGARRAARGAPPRCVARLVGAWVAKSRNSKPTISMPFSSTRLRGMRGISPDAIADGHEPAAPVQRAQRGLGEVAHRPGRRRRRRRPGARRGGPGAGRPPGGRQVPGAARRGDLELLGRRRDGGHGGARAARRAAPRPGRRRRRHRARSALRPVARPRPNGARGTRCGAPPRTRPRARSSTPSGMRVTRRGGDDHLLGEGARRSRFRTRGRPTAALGDAAGHLLDRAGELAAGHERRAAR